MDRRAFHAQPVHAGTGQPAQHAQAADPIPIGCGATLARAYRRRRGRTQGTPPLHFGHRRRLDRLAGLPRHHPRAGKILHVPLQQQSLRRAVAGIPPVAGLPQGRRVHRATHHRPIQRLRAGAQGRRLRRPGGAAASPQDWSQRRQHRPAAGRCRGQHQGTHRNVPTRRFPAGH